jgi:acyl-CoA thioester hydrolase
MALENFRCVQRFRVRFCDVDMLQHVNNAAYIVWAETARCIYLSEVLEEPLLGSTSAIVARQDFTYEHPLRYREPVAVGCRISRIGGKSFDFAYEIWSETHNRRAAHGITAMAVYDYRALCSIAFPERWRKIVAAYEPLAPQGL